tara:strand:+ start:2539 stop:2724 length:186 start_codon:yes stop_codon:yes gene_type:complete
MPKINKKYTETERNHISDQLDCIRQIVRHCSEDRMPEGACDFCLALYKTALNNAIDAGVWE